MSIDEEAEKWFRDGDDTDSCMAIYGDKGMICAGMNDKESEFILRACRCHRRLVGIAKFRLRQCETLTNPIEAEFLKKLIADAEGRS